MSDEAQRVLDALMEYERHFPIETIGNFRNFVNSDDCSEELSEDYESLTANEEKQVIKAFLEYEY